MPTLQSRYWCFTLNFSGEMPDLSTMFDNTCVAYACWQHERGSHDHLQGYVQCKGTRTIAQVLKVFSPLHPHLEKQRARKSDQARDYCLKDESRVAGPWEFGMYVAMGSNKRKVLELLQDPENEVWEPQKYRRAVAMTIMEDSRKWARENPFPYELHDWQVELTELLSQPADKRTIIWVYGPKGAEGKTEFAKYLGLKDDWLYLPGGKTNDLMYMYSRTPDRNLVLDMPRCSGEFVSYAFLEMVKNRTIYSYKYEPIGFISADKYVHVVVFANFRPAIDDISGSPGKIVSTSRISKDRIKLIDLS